MSPGIPTPGTSGSSLRTGTALPRTYAEARPTSFAALVAAVEAATYEELFAENPHPWLDGTLAETVIEDSTRHFPDHVAQLI